MPRLPTTFATLLALSALALGPAAPAPAQAASLSPGTVELNPSFAFNSSRYFLDGTLQFTTSTTDLSGFVGYCVSDRLELGGALLISRLSADPCGGAGISVTSAGLSGGVTVNFSSTGKLVPYLRGSLGFLSNTGDVGGSETTYLVPLLEGGLRAMVGSTASVNFVVGFQHQVHAGGEPDQSANIITLGIGMSVFPVLGKPR
jgi:hypothetical protein